MTEKLFTHDLGDIAVVACSGEMGEVIARAEFANGEDQYQIRYKSADGRAVEEWWGESALQSLQ